MDTKRSSKFIQLSLAIFGFSLFIGGFLYGQNQSYSLTSNPAPAPRTDGEEQTIRVYKKANQTVVNVSTRGFVQGLFGVTAQEGSGSGVIVDAERALVVTNFHVVEQAAAVGQVVVTLSDGQSYRTALVGKDPDNDIALLQIQDPPSSLVAVEFGDSSSLEVGQRVFAIGNPFGLNRTLTEGIISALERSLTTESGREVQNVIQTDAAINPGNSGGPLLDALGRLIGINTAIVSNTGQSAGIGFAIPANIVRESLPLLVKYGKVPRPKIGVAISNTEYGAVITYVQPGSPADKAGLSGAHQARTSGLFSFPVVDVSDADFVLEINGKEVSTSEDCYRELSKSESGKHIELIVRRGILRGKTRVVKIKPILG
jgi:S1-C subfamily serine protease